MQCIEYILRQEVGFGKAQPASQEEGHSQIRNETTPDTTGNRSRLKIQAVKQGKHAREHPVKMEIDGDLQEH